MFSSYRIVLIAGILTISQNDLVRGRSIGEFRVGGTLSLSDHAPNPTQSHLATSSKELLLPILSGSEPSAADRVDTTILDLTQMQISLKDDTAPEFVNLREMAAKAVDFLQQNRDAVVLRLQGVANNGSEMIKLLTQFTAANGSFPPFPHPESSKDTTTEESTGDVVTSTHDSTDRKTDNSEENEILFI